MKTIKLLASLSLCLLTAACSESDIGRSAERKAIEVMGAMAQKRMSEGGHGGFHATPVAVKRIHERVWQVQGTGNTQAIQTDEGVVLFDTGLIMQAGEQRKQLKPELEGPVTHIILSHSHADHVGGWKVWRERDTVTIAHREFEEEQRYLTELADYQHRRNWVMFTWLPKERPQNALMDFRGIVPDITVGERDYQFEQGGVNFEVLSTPGAEGADNVSLWLPNEKILFTGDTLGPNFPQFPNIFTARGEKIRKPVEYLHTLDKLIALQPEILVPSHRDAISGRDTIVSGLQSIRDAVHYVHQAVVDGMNAGKTVYELMESVRLPPELQLTEEHGKVSWAVRSIWEYYATWFHFDSPTELYHVPVRELYDDITELAGSEALITRARQYLNDQQALPALHLAEMILAAESDHKEALELAKQALEQLRHSAKTVSKNTYEYDILSMYIGQIEEQLKAL